MNIFQVSQKATPKVKELIFECASSNRCNLSEKFVLRQIEGIYSFKFLIILCWKLTASVEEKSTLMQKKTESPKTEIRETGSKNALV